MDAKPNPKYKLMADFHNPNYDFPHFTKAYVVEQHTQSGEVVQQVLVHGCAGPVDAMCKAKLDKTSHYKLGHKPVTVHAYQTKVCNDSLVMMDEQRHGMTPAVEEFTEV